MDCIWERNHSQKITLARDDKTRRNWGTSLPSLSPHCKDMSYLRKDAVDPKIPHLLMWLQNSLKHHHWHWSTVWQYFRQIIPTQISNLLCSKLKLIISQLKTTLLFCLVVLHSWSPVSLQGHSTSLSTRSPFALERKKKKYTNFQLLKVPVNLKDASGYFIHHLQTEHCSQNTQKNCFY